MTDVITMPEARLAQYQVLTAGLLDFALTYLGPEGLEPGQGVVVPVRGASAIGVVWPHKDGLQTGRPEFKGELKVIDEVLEWTLTPLFMEFMSRMAQYNCQPLGYVLKNILGISPAEHRNMTRNGYDDGDGAAFPVSAISLSKDQQEACALVREHGEEYFPVLLDGVTGSGKTETFLQAAADVLAKGKQALILLPEIGLTAQVIERVERRLGFEPHVWHSKLRGAKRRKLWQDAAAGKPMLVIAARSGILLPLRNPGLIVVDEEHDSTYKQEEQLLYNARDMAVMRAWLEKIPVILASATPCLESWHNAAQGRYRHVSLPARYAGAKLPEVETIDMKKDAPAKGKWLSKPLLRQMLACLERGEQVLLYLNRRGYAPLTVCCACGEKVSCSRCSSHLVYHRQTCKYQCHYCGLEKINVQACPSCQAPAHDLLSIGPGVERVAQEVQECFPEYPLALCTSDHLQTSQDIEKLRSQVLNKDVRILLGTQMLAKGHHFPDITLVGVIDGDLGLGGFDLRCGERTYQLLHQVAGRCGRAEKPGRVLIQTYQPEHPVMQALIHYQRDAFLELEIQEREAHNFPPFSRLCAVIVSAKDERLCEQGAQRLADTAPQYEQIEVMGPIIAPMAKIRGLYRRRFLLKFPRNIRLDPVIREWTARAGLPRSLRVVTDMDPQQFH